ncbi:MAG: 2-oxoacid:ferredoxin oxidoreductase subunit beta [Deltaproteobacteria bacterium]|nr:2-oxoacid:ferredoxin oxidoreductase subunit beta [Deltaproteobacteria bacterium]
MTSRIKKTDLVPESCHPQDDLLRTDRIPHIWCSGCGIGTVFSCLISAVRKAGLDASNATVVSGIGCTGRMAGYIKLHSSHTTHGRAIPFATGIKLAKPDATVIVASGDGDLFAIGGNHFIHAARRNMDLAVICVNNFNYGMTGGQMASSTPFGAKTTTSLNGNPEEPFNFCNLAAASGASYVARWTSLDIRRLGTAIHEAMTKPGFSFVEILAPCPTSFGRRNKMRTAIELARFVHSRAVVKNNIEPKAAVIDFNREIVLGKFVDISRPTFLDNYRTMYRRELGEWPDLDRTGESKSRSVRDK